MGADTQFQILLEDHIQSLSDRQRFSGLLRDLLPGMTLQSNILLNLYDLGIHSDIEQAQQIDSAFAYRYTKKLCDEYGVSRRNANWAVAAWCNCYGGEILRKPVNTADPEPSETDFQGGAAPDTPETAYDIEANEYLTDWRDIYDYDIIDRGAVIHKYIDFETQEVTVPETIEGYPVVEIGEEAFFNCKAIKRLNLPRCIKAIKGHAFENCTFETIELPQSLEEIEYSAFEYTALKEIRIPSKVGRLNRLVFGHCEELVSVELAQGLKNIEGRAFFHCGKLETIDIPQGTREIGAHAFEECKSLKSIRIPKTVVIMGRHDYAHENIFGEPVAGNLTIYCEAGSEALKYARRHSISIAQYGDF